MRRTRFLLLLPIWLSCHDPITPVPPVTDPGFVVVSITSPFVNTGAIRFELRGPGIDSVETPFAMLGAPESPELVRTIVIGPIGNGVVFHYWVPDRNALGDYEVLVVEAAARDTYAQLDRGSFVVSVLPDPN